MEYYCLNCNYKTRRKVDFDRHLRRKFSCNKNDKTSNGIDTDASMSSKKEDIDPEKVDVDPEKVDADPEKVDADPEKVDGLIQCSKCSKLFTRKDHMRVHERKCDGFHKLQCRVCLRMFSSKYGKSQHIKYVKCVPPITQNITNNNITNNNNIDNSITNNHQQYITNNNIRLCFGSEVIEKICNEDGYMKRMEEYVKLLKYALPNALEDVYFNEKHPENQTIKKDRRNDNLVSIHVGENRWEKRYARDMVSTTLEKIHAYMEKYIEDVKLTGRRRRELRLFGKEMAKLKYWDTESIEDKLEMDEYDESTEENMRKEGKIVTKLLVDKMYERTKEKADG